MRAQKSLSATTLPYHVFGLTHPGRSCGDPHQAPLNDTVTARGRAQCTVDDRIRFIVLLDEGDVSVDPDQVSHFPDEVVWVPVRRICHFVELAIVEFAIVPVRSPVIGHEGVYAYARAVDKQRPVGSSWSPLHRSAAQGVPRPKPRRVDDVAVGGIAAPLDSLYE